MASDSPQPAASPSAMRAELRTLHFFCQLVTNLTQGAMTNPEVKSGLEGVATFIEKSSDADICTKGEQVQLLLQTAAFDTKCPWRAKGDWHKVAFEYWQVLSEPGFKYDDGLPYGWVEDRLDCTSGRIPPDLPRHARVSLVAHAGNISIEEAFLLADAFYLLVKARQAMELLDQAAASVNSFTVEPRLYSLNQNVATYSRLTVHSFFAFVECFVNGVGNDYAARHPDISEHDRSLLRGVLKGRYLSLAKKLECFPSVTRPDRCSPIKPSKASGAFDEPFFSLLSCAKPVRDAAAHYAPGKTRIWLPPRDWLARAESACRTSMAAAREFWDACHPGRGGPYYLYCLDIESQVLLAQRRLGWEAGATPEGEPPGSA